MARKMGRIQAYEYWSEQYHSSTRLVNTLIRVRHGGPAAVRVRGTGQYTCKRDIVLPKAERILVLARRRQARMLAMAERFEKPVPRKAGART